MILEERISRLGTTIKNSGAIYYMTSNLCLPNERTGLLVYVEDPLRNPTQHTEEIDWQSQGVKVFIMKKMPTRVFLCFILFYFILLILFYVM